MSFRRNSKARAWGKFGTKVNKVKRDQIFLTTATRASDFEFNAEVAEVFDQLAAQPMSEIETDKAESSGNENFSPRERVHRLFPI